MRINKLVALTIVGIISVSLIGCKEEKHSDSKKAAVSVSTKPTETPSPTVETRVEEKDLTQRLNYIGPQVSDGYVLYQENTNEGYYLEYEYDSKGHLVKRSFCDINTKEAYESEDFYIPTSLDEINNSEEYHGLVAFYDENDNLVYLAEDGIIETYDVNGNVLSSSNGDYISQYVYNEDGGLIHEVTIGEVDQIVIDYVLDEEGRITSEFSYSVVYNSEGKEESRKKVSFSSYIWEDDDHYIKIVDWEYAPEEVVSIVNTYKYDDYERVIEKTIITSIDDENYTESFQYEYDDFGHLISETDSQGVTYTYKEI